jgi:hypothetical protein
MNEKNTIRIAFTSDSEIKTKRNPFSDSLVTRTKLSKTQAILLRDELIHYLAEMGEPVKFDSEYICTTDLLDCHFEVQHDCS